MKLWLALGCCLILGGCGAPSPQPTDEEARKAFRGGPMPPKVAAKIKARQKSIAPTATVAAP